MTLCINPNCSHPKNSDDLLICSGCASKLLLEGRYRVIQMLGEGGFSKTYEVRDGARNPKVLKVLSKDSPKAIKLFKQEAEILSRLNILGIPKGKEYFTFFLANQEKPLHCFVMEKINGENLEEWMEKRNNQPIRGKNSEADTNRKVASKTISVYGFERFVDFSIKKPLDQSTTGGKNSEADTNRKVAS
jgi:serine/threonine protein kinase